ncbi:hypothetical protein [Ornithinimicrobium sufpigmenti]|uniref:hypothetical protein n=1 Tax=Ornithinimicrobium sufpigmenti TaxID=2508882 RepID=UPI001035C2A1|nr:MULTISPECIES: hypothetical protein [unclassified Ornithinimicrobium]
MTSSSAEARSSTGSTIRSSPTRLMLLWAVPAGLAITVAGALVAWLAVDGMAALSALVGGVLSLGVFGLGIVAIRGLLSGPGQIVMSGAFFVFLVQIALTGGVLFLLSRSDQVSLMALGLTFIVVGLAVQAGTVVGALRARVSLDVDPGAAPSVSVAPTTKGVDR